MRILLVLILSIVPVSAFCSFDATVSPPRFELKAKRGELVRQVINISNMSSLPKKFRIRTEDWDYSDDASKVYYHAGNPKPGSCRPWARIERHVVNIPGQRAKPYRFEIHVPKDAKPTSCHFAIIVAPDTSDASSVGNVRLVGRIAVIIYLTVGDAKPELEFKNIGMKDFENKHIPVIEVHNAGNAHARPGGILQAIDAKKRKLELWVGSLPILPKQTRPIPLFPMDWSSGEAKPADFTLEPPIHIKGSVEWGNTKTRLDQSIR